MTVELSWAGKNTDIDLSTQSTLEPCIEESVDFDASENLFIEGENLEVLKILQKSYSNKIKTIYIDPPYNTGNKFMYNDRFNHSDWLSMMYPRLKLARELLTDDGVIFISIDDNEQAYLKVLMDEVFGRKNFVIDLIRKTKSTTNDNKSGVNIQHDNALCYAKNIENIELQGDAKDFSKYQNPDNDSNGRWVITDPSARTGSYFEIKNPYTGKIDLPPVGREWQFSKKSFEEHVATGKIIFKREYKDSERGFIFKRYESELRSTFHKLNSLQFCENDYMNQSATKDIIRIFGEKVFDYTKPVGFIEKLLNSATDKYSITLDFFAGSCTTADAVMQLNASDGGNRKYIMIQIPEVIDKKKFPDNPFETIADIGKERIRRAKVKIENETGKAVEGFKVLKLACGNIRTRKL